MKDKEKNKIQEKGLFFTKSKRFHIVLNIILICIVFVTTAAIIYYHIEKYQYNSNITITHDSSGSYVYTNPILDCEYNNIVNSDISLFSNETADKVEELKNKFGLDNVSLYFRDLNDGPWVGVGEKEVFSPASLLKVPILVELLHAAENDPTLLDRVVEISSAEINQNIYQNIKPSKPLIVGNKYTLLDVLKSMIEESDNTAVAAILQNIDSDHISHVFKAVGVPFKDTKTEVNVRVKDYAGFFRILFNASYLSRDMSEKALEILSKSEYDDGIVAGVPSGVIVAHKFGERKIEGEQDTNQLHDCGIVYYPGKPYIICIMTRGNNYEYQGKVIQELSKYIYNEVDKNEKK